MTPSFYEELPLVASPGPNVPSLRSSPPFLDCSRIFSRPSHDARLTHSRLCQPDLSFHDPSFPSRHEDRGPAAAGAPLLRVRVGQHADDQHGPLAPPRLGQLQERRLPGDIRREVFFNDSFLGSMSDGPSSSSPLFLSWIEMRLSRTARRRSRRVKFSRFRVLSLDSRVYQKL